MYRYTKLNSQGRSYYFLKNCPFPHFCGSHTMLVPSNCHLLPAIGFVGVCLPMQLITIWWKGGGSITFHLCAIFQPIFQSQNWKWILLSQLSIFIPNMMKSATVSKMSYNTEMCISSSTNKINAINILAVYTPHITIQTSGVHLFHNFDRVFRANLPPATLPNAIQNERRNVYQFVGIKVKVAFKN